MSGRPPARRDREPATGWRRWMPLGAAVIAGLVVIGCVIAAIELGIRFF